MDFEWRFHDTGILTRINQLIHNVRLLMSETGRVCAHKYNAKNKVQGCMNLALLESKDTFLNENDNKQCQINAIPLAKNERPVNIQQNNQTTPKNSHCK